MTYNKEQQREYAKRHYLDNKGVYKNKSRLRVSLLRKILVELKHQEPCMDCGIRYPYWVMQFDHRPGTVKLFQIADVHLIGSVSRLLDELDKCDLVCANCHADRTYQRLQDPLSQTIYPLHSVKLAFSY
jgi:hypothetical protein